MARTTNLLDSRKNIQMTGRIYMRAVVPIGVLYSGSLVCSNLVYLYLSVPFIQMLKAAAPVAVLFASWAWGLKEPSMRAFLNIALIVFGVMLASLGEIEFSWVGFMFQVGGIVFEAMRVVMVEVMLKGEGGLQKMDPLVSLYYYAPVCALMNTFVALFSEFGTFKMEDVWSTGVGVLFLNAGVAFMLNVASVFLVSSCCPLPSLSLSCVRDRSCSMLNDHLPPSIDWQDVRSRPHPHGNPQERAPDHRLHHDLAHEHHGPAVLRLRRRHLRPARLLGDDQVRARRSLQRLGAEPVGVALSRREPPISASTSLDHDCGGRPYPVHALLWILVGRRLRIRPRSVIQPARASQ